MRYGVIYIYVSELTLKRAITISLDGLTSIHGVVRTCGKANPSDSLQNSRILVLPRLLDFFSRKTTNQQV